jgi:hypothetical protein
MSEEYLIFNLSSFNLLYNVDFNLQVCIIECIRRTIKVIDYNNARWKPEICELLCFSFRVLSGIIFVFRMTQMHDTCKSRGWVTETLFLLDRSEIVNRSAHGHCLRHL